MTNEVPMRWPEDRTLPATPGWYRLPSGSLSYWTGRRWSQVPSRRRGADVRAPSPLTKRVAWRAGVFVVGWIAAVLALGMVLHGVEAGGVDCGTVFGRFVTAGDQLCNAALRSRAIVAGLTAVLSGLSFLAVAALRPGFGERVRSTTQRIHPGQKPAACF
jgi:hypothetical protein